MISGIYFDIRTDGKLDDAKLQSALINKARLLDIPSIGSNLIHKYSELGADIEMKEFGKHIDFFINTTDYLFTKTIGYPQMVNSLLNVLSDTAYSWTINKLDADSTNLEAYGTGQTISVPFAFGPTSVDFFVFENKHLLPDRTFTIP